MNVDETLRKILKDADEELGEWTAPIPLKKSEALLEELELLSRKLAVVVQEARVAGADELRSLLWLKAVR